MSSRLTTLLMTFVLVLCAGLQSQAAEATLSQGAITVSIETTWSGGKFGGYYPIRMKLKNEGPAVDLTIQFAAPEELDVRQPTVTDEVHLDPQSSLITSLSVPLVSSGYLGELTFADSAGVLADLTYRVTIPDREYDIDSVTGSVIVVTDELLRTEQIDFAIKHHAFQLVNGYSGESAVLMEPEMLSSKWIDYSSLDLIVTEPRLWEKLTPGVQNAMIQWVEAGGTLLLYNTADSEKATTGFSSVSPFGAKWKSSNRKAWRRVSPQDEDTRSLLREHRAEWPSGFQYRRCLSGMLITMEHHPFPGTASDWYWFCRTIGEDRLAWSHRWGISARRSNATFLEFLIPSVQGVPVIAFLTLITLFTIFIGPINYIICLKRKQLTLLLLTVPILAFGTSLLLGSVSTVSHGFAVKSRARSITLLDQKSRHQVTISREALFSGFRSIPELKFATDTAIFPIRARTQQFHTRRSNEEYTGGDYDFRNGQALTHGWLPARTRTQFLVVSHETTRQRLEVSMTPAGVEVSNGLESDLERLYLCDATGELWFAEHIPAGAVQTLSPAKTEDRTVLFELLNNEVIELPEGMTDSQTGLSHYTRQQTAGTNHYKNNLPERMINEWKLISVRPKVIENNTYLALVKQANHLQKGVEQTRPEKDLHLLWGAF